MKRLLTNVKVIAAFTILFLATSCKKDETRAVLDSSVAPTLAVSKNTVVLNQANAGDTAVVFTWNSVNYGFQDAISYTLQIAKAGTNFASATSTEISVAKSNLRKAFTVGELNAELNKILPAGAASQVEVRIKSSLSENYSNTVALTATPYKVLVFYNYPQAINVAGNFQGWTPGTAPQIVSVANNNQYEGFIDFGTTATPEFKFVKGNDWPAGDFGGTTTGTLTNGGSNLKLTSGGVHLIRANTTAMTWSAVKINSWGLIGDAIAGTEWNSDRDLTYNAATKTWSITLDLIGGKFIKFRANDSWDINLGDRGADFKPELGVNDNIAVPTSGNYTVTLDILTGGNWTYTLKKN